MSESPPPSEIGEIVFSKQKIPAQSLQSSLSLNTSFRPLDERNTTQTQQAPQRQPQPQTDIEPNKNTKAEFFYGSEGGDDQAMQELSDTLALNALKKLSLGSNNVNNTVEQDNIDLSTFASLTRQPRLDSTGDQADTSVLNNLTSVSSEAANASAESEGLMLRPMRRQENKSAMNQYERRRPVSPSPLLKGEPLDLPLKPQTAQDNDNDTKINAAKNVQEFHRRGSSSSKQQQHHPLVEKLVQPRLDSIKSDSHLMKKSEPQQSQQLPQQQVQPQQQSQQHAHYKPATLMTSTQPVKAYSQPASATQAEFSIQHPVPQQVQAHYSNSSVPIKDDDRYKDPQSINKLKRPLYVPAVLRPTMANNYSDMASSTSSLISDGFNSNAGSGSGTVGMGHNDNGSQVSRDLQRYKDFNNLSYIGGNGRGTSSPVGSLQMAPSMSQQSSLSSSPGQQQTNKFGKILEKIMSTTSSSSSLPSQAIAQQQQQQAQQFPFVPSQNHSQQQSDAASIISSSSSIYEMGPTREHWKLDTMAIRCENCSRIFTNFGKIRRKHHCRSCGGIFCTNCINHYIYLDKNAEFVLIDVETKPKMPAQKKYTREEKYLSKVCYHCFENYENLLRQKNPALFNVPVLRKVDCTQDYEEEEEEDEDEDDTGVDGGDGKLKNESTMDMNTNANDANLPANWNWSSF